VCGCCIDTYVYSSRSLASIYNQTVHMIFHSVVRSISPIKYRISIFADIKLLLCVSMYADVLFKNNYLVSCLVISTAQASICNKYLLN
jgi:hypothetical protein